MSSAGGHRERPRRAVRTVGPDAAATAPGLAALFGGHLAGLGRGRGVTADVAALVVAVQNGERWLDKKRLAEHYACSVRSVETAMAEGMPHTVIFGRPKFRPAETDPWL